jgi:hypothetical protein
MRENHGYTVPARWLHDLDAVPDGDTREPDSGYLVGIETPTDPTLCRSHCNPNHGRRDRADMPEIANHGVQYHVLPDEPLAALNILREAGGLESLSDEDDPALGDRESIGSKPQVSE